MSESILVIPDCHSKPESTTDRFDWLGQYIVDEKPDHIVQVGDFLDMQSLSSYDKGKGTGEGKRFAADVAAGRRDLEALFAPMDRHNLNRRKKKKAPYKPNKVFLWGNHEDRIRKWENDNPALSGMVEVHMGGIHYYFDEVVPFKQIYVNQGIAFCHYFPSKMGRAIGGKNAARTITLEVMMSNVSGHSHNLHHCVHTRGDGQKLIGLVGGWYGDVSHSERWSAGTEHSWWNGVILLDDIENGFPHRVEFITQDALRREYGNPNV